MSLLTKTHCMPSVAGGNADIENSVDFALPPDQAEAVKVVTTPAVPVQAVGLPSVQSFESWIETLGDLYRKGSGGVHFAECFQHVFQMLLARDLLDEYRAFLAVCDEPAPVPTPCLFPQPPFKKPSSLLLLTGYEGASCFEIQDGIDPFNQCGLDAPLFLPMGGSDSMLIAGRTVGFSLVPRP